MPLYKQTELSGTAYNRAHLVVCENPMGGNPSVSFHEQRVVLSDSNETVVQNIGVFRAEMTTENLGSEFLLVDMNGEPTGATMTYAQVYGVLQSLHMHLAALRDQAGT